MNEEQESTLDDVWDWLHRKLGGIKASELNPNKVRTDTIDFLSQGITNPREIAEYIILIN